MPKKRSTPYLRLVVTPDEPETRACRPEPPERGGVFLGFVDTSTSSRALLEELIAKIRPTWLFDLRPVPYFNIEGLSRRRVFEMFREHGIAYRDVSGALGIVERNDASLNSGAVAQFLNQVMTANVDGALGSVAILLDDREWLERSVELLPKMLLRPGEGWDVRVLGSPHEAAEPRAVAGEEV